MPVIQTTNGWMKDFVEEHQVGFTVNPNDANDLANLLERLFDNPGELKTMCLNAKKIAAKEFDKNLLAQKMLSAIESI